MSRNARRISNVWTVRAGASKNAHLFPFCLQKVGRLSGNLSAHFMQTTTRSFALFNRNIYWRAMDACYEEPLHVGRKNARIRVRKFPAELCRGNCTVRSNNQYLHDEMKFSIRYLPWPRLSRIFPTVWFLSKFHRRPSRHLAARANTSLTKC